MTDQGPEDPTASSEPPVNRVRNAQSPRISRSDKRRNRRRKSKYARPLISVAHGLVALQFVLVALFVAAIGQGLMQGADLTFRSVDTQRLQELNLPGSVDPIRQRRGLGILQLAIWSYLFGAPVLFAVQRAFFWRRTMTAAKYFTVTAMGVWAVIIMVILVTAVMG